MLILFHPLGSDIITSVADDTGNIRDALPNRRSSEMPPRILPWWRLDLSLRGMQILHKLYTLDVGRRTCMRFKPMRRQQARQARGQPNATPSLFAFVPFLSLSFFARVSCSLDDNARHPSWYASPQTTRMTCCKSDACVRSKLAPIQYQLPVLLDIWTWIRHYLQF